MQYRITWLCTAIGGVEGAEFDGSRARFVPLRIDGAGSAELYVILVVSCMIYCNNLYF